MQGVKMEAWQKIKQVKQLYSDDEIREIFKHRRDDEMFLQIGQLAKRKIDKTKQDLIWRGYELLVNSPYMEV